MKAMRTGILLLLLIGCDQRQAKMSDAEMHKLRAEAPYLTEACLERISLNGIESLAPNEDCSQRLPPRRWHGLWRNDFEGSLFCPAPAQECTNGGRPLSERIWLELEPRPAIVRDGALYAVEFIGRRTARGSPYAGSGYPQDIIVDRMISMKELQPPPKQ
jgi:hypothetical protein